MHRNRMTWMAAVLGTAAVTGLMGCGKDKIDAIGSASVSVKALSIADIASVTVTVQGATMPAPITVPLTKNGAQYSALVSSLPVGTDYTFTASAKDAGNVELYHGGVTGQTIAKNQTANVVINMNQNATPDPLVNEAPVIDTLTATSLSVSNNDLVTVKVAGHDPDGEPDTLGIAWVWESTCPGSLGTPSPTPGATTSLSQIVFTAPATDGPCTINVTAKDARLPDYLQTKASLTIQVNAASAAGNAKITAIPNTCPVMVDLRANPLPLDVGAPVTLSVSATDSDGDGLHYAWVSPDCTGTFDPAGANAQTVTFTLGAVPPSFNCTFLVTVDDGTFPNGGLKCSIVNHLSVPVHNPAGDVQSSCAWGYDYQSRDMISGTDEVKLEIVAPSTGCPAGWVIEWVSSDSELLTPLATLDPPFTSGVTYTAPAGAEDGTPVTVTVTASCPGLPVDPCSHEFLLVPANNFCADKDNGTPCELPNKCITGTTCQDHVCAGTAKVCDANPDQCKQNTCDPADGVCKEENKAEGTTCDDGQNCTEADKCSAGICGGVAKVCPGDGNECHVGVCNPANGACGIADAADGTSCDDSNLCTGATPPGDTCTAGTCGGAETECQAGYVCTPSTGLCDPKVCLNASYAKKIVPPLMGLSVNPAGTPWMAGQIYNPFDFGTGTLASSGSADIYLAQVIPGSGMADLVFTFGDVNSKDQAASGVAVASQGNVGLIGTTTGEIQFTDKNSDGSAPGGEGVAGVDYLSATALTPFYGVFLPTAASPCALPAPATCASPVKAHMVDVGTGSLLSVASNPNVNAFAFCGKTSKAVPTWSATSATNKGVITTGAAGPHGGGMDIVVAKVDAVTGNVLWGRQFGGSADQVCDSVTIANNGDVIIAGNYTGTLDFGGGIALPPVADTTAGLVFVAKLASADGVPLAAATWGGSGRNNAYGLTVDASDNIVVAGSLNGNIDFGGGISIVNTGLTDVFALKLTSALAPVWATSFGDSVYDQSAKTVGVASGGDVFIGGSFKGTLGALGLTSASTTALDAFTAQLAAADGSVLCAKAFGDGPGAQSTSMLTVARTASGSLANSVMIGGAFSSDITLGATTLSTGSASLAASYLSRLVP